MDVRGGWCAVSSAAAPPGGSFLASPRPLKQTEIEVSLRHPFRLGGRCVTVHVSPPPLSAGHPPPGDFIALGSKGQASESKTGSTLLKPAPSGLPSERKRDAAAALAGASALTGLTKRPKLSSTPPLSALGRLAEAAVAEKRAISPSIKEPSVVPIEGKVGPWTSRRTSPSDTLSVH